MASTRNPPAGSRCFELRLLAGLAAPSAILSALRISQLLVDQSVIGHLRHNGHSTAVYLDAAALALLWMTVTMTTFQRGLSSTINTLVSQALGANNRRLADTWLLTGMLLAIPCSLLCCVLWLLTAKIVGLFAHNQSVGPDADSTNCSSTLAGQGWTSSAGQVDAHVPPLALVWPGSAASLMMARSSTDDSAGDPVALAGQYARLSLGIVLPTLWMELVSQYLIAQRVVHLQLCVYTAAFFLNAGLNILFVHGIGGVGGLGFVGSPLATTTTRVTQLIALLAALACSSVPTPKPKLSDAVKPARLRRFLVQFLPCALSSMLEEIALQFVGALSGRLPAVQTAAHSATLMGFFALTSPVYGVGTASQQRMGFHLGAGNPRAARQTAALCVCVMLALGLLVAATIVGTRHELGKLFSNDCRVVDVVAAIAPLVAGAYCLIGLFYASMATLNGQGRPLPVALAFFLGAFLLAPALGYVFAFVLHCCGAIKLYGLWLGLIAGYFVTSLIACGAVLLSDWPAISRKAQERSEATTCAPTLHDGGCGGPTDGLDEPAAAARMATPLLAESGAGGSVRGLDGGASQVPQVQPTPPAPPAPHAPMVVPPMPVQRIKAAEAETWADAD